MNDKKIILSGKNIEKIYDNVSVLTKISLELYQGDFDEAIISELELSEYEKRDKVREKTLTAWLEIKKQRNCNRKNKKEGLLSNEKKKAIDCSKITFEKSVEKAGFFYICTIFSNLCFCIIFIFSNYIIQSFLIIKNPLQVICFYYKIFYQDFC